MIVLINDSLHRKQYYSTLASFGYSLQVEDYSRSQPSMAVTLENYGNASRDHSVAIPNRVVGVRRKVAA